MPEQSEDNNHTSKINVFPVLHTIFFLLAGQKVDLFAPHGAIKSTLWPANKKNTKIKYFSFIFHFKFYTRYKGPKGNFSVLRRFQFLNFFFRSALQTKALNYFFYQRAIKWTLLPRAGQTNPLSDPIVEKNHVQHGKNIYFTRVVVTLALLGHQTSHSQNKFFFPSCTMY